MVLEISYLEANGKSIQNKETPDSLRFKSYVQNQLSFIGSSACNSYCVKVWNDHLQSLDLPQIHVQLFDPFFALSHSKTHAKRQCVRSHLGPSAYMDTTLLCHQMKATYSNFQLRQQLPVDKESFCSFPKEKNIGEQNCHLVLTQLTPSQQT